MAFAVVAAHVCVGGWRCIALPRFFVPTHVGRRGAGMADELLTSLSSTNAY